jgi:hypothetical protein
MAMRAYIDSCGYGGLRGEENTWTIMFMLNSRGPFPL